MSQAHPVKVALDGRWIAVSLRSEDKLVRNCQAALSSFNDRSGIPPELRWKYLPDEEFGRSHTNNPAKHNRALISHLTRIIEACEIVSVRRATDLIAGCIRGLNNDELISASALARSLIELAASYGDAANYLNAYFKKFPWEEIDKKYLVSHDSSTTDEGRGLEGYIAALALAA